jgi:hypothetical protein
MNGPKEATAVWKADYTIPIAAAATIALAAGILALRGKKKKRTERRRR